MKVLRNRAYKTELKPNNRQRTLLRKHAGAARVAYNWGLGRKIDAYKDSGKSPNAIALHRDLNGLKGKPREEGGFPWAYEVSKCAFQEGLRDLDRAFKNFFRRCKQRAARKGFPRFKAKRDGQGSFRLTGAIKATDTHVQLPRLGKIRLKERGYLPTLDRKDVRILSATVSERAGRWFVSLSVEQEQEVPTPKTHVVGVDVGLKHLAVTSDGQVFENPKALKRAEGRLRLLQKSVSRKKKGSNNRRKAKRKVAKQHFRISNIRRDAIAKMTTMIAKSASTIVVESLHVKGMLKNRCLSKAISDASLGQVLTQLEYKSAWHGATLVKADRWFPSSKRCSSCGSIKADLTLSDRTYECGSCGVAVDRDLNAALNLKSLAGSSPVPPIGREACGEDVRPLVSVRTPRQTSVKQEPNSAWV